MTFTHKHRPWEMLAVFEVGNNRGEAMKIERFIKKQKSKQFIKNLIDAEKHDGILTQLVRVPNLRD